jgi:hypothetical protein
MKTDHASAETEMDDSFFYNGMKLQIKMKNTFRKNTCNLSEKKLG